MTWRVRAVWTGLAGAPYLSTFYFTPSGSPTPAAAVTAVNVFLTQFQDFYSNDLSVSIEPEVAQFSTPDTIVAMNTIVPPAAVSGNGGTTEAPRATQGLLRLRTGIFVGGREIRGRIFLPGVTSTGVANNGVPTPAYIIGANSAADNLETAGLMVASRKNNLFYEVSNTSCWSEFAVLRGRRD